MEWQVGKQVSPAFSVAVEQPPGWGEADKALGIGAATSGNGVSPAGRRGLFVNFRTP